jgi:hypothetical protein
MVLISFLIWMSWYKLLLHIFFLPLACFSSIDIPVHAHRTRWEL